MSLTQALAFGTQCDPGKVARRLRRKTNTSAYNKNNS
jgi:hypothetical protein